MKDQFILFLTAVAIVTAIIFLLSLLTVFLQRLMSTELSDQLGWKNFKKPAIGISFISIALLGIIIVVLAIYGALN